MPVMLAETPTFQWHSDTAKEHVKEDNAIITAENK